MSLSDPINDIARLHALRRLMASLRTEEAELRARLMTLGDGDHGGNGIRIRIATQVRRQLDQSAIPPEILARPDVWQEIRSRAVRLLP
ncbi:hypothetical protein [Jannaschia pohangensis]|uniref:Uncharacterized protein n=1 Tax=Jannaschia pohangensis TaxID=390807 RepID=A0A1I3HM53_9RHOB|nr:hypothetical protein [Jannaschia pohangensis]SFI36689.1 hypothetical protein SAMN04488095_0649 [Jannaschia pohangensis]